MNTTQVMNKASNPFKGKRPVSRSDDVSADVIQMPTTYSPPPVAPAVEDKVKKSPGRPKKTDPDLFVATIPDNDPDLSDFSWLPRPSAKSMHIYNDTHGRSLLAVLRCSDRTSRTLAFGAKHCEGKRWSILPDDKIRETLTPLLSEAGYTKFPLYNERILAARPDDIVVFTTDEVAADEIARRVSSVVAVSCFGGDKEIKRSSLASIIDRQVVVLLRAGSNATSDAKAINSAINQARIERGAFRTAPPPVKVAFWPDFLPENWQAGDPMPETSPGNDGETNLFANVFGWKSLIENAIVVDEIEDTSAGLPPGFDIERGFLYFTPPAMGKKGAEDAPSRIKVSEAFSVAGVIIDAETGERRVKIEWRDRDTGEQREFMPLKSLIHRKGGEDIRAGMEGLGLSCPPAGAPFLMKFISEHASAMVDYSFSKAGWRTIKGRHIFASPGGVVTGDDDNSLHFITASDAGKAFTSSGTLDDWQTHVAEPLGHNKFGVLALSTAFAGPLINIPGSLGKGVAGGWNFVGAKKTGKTILLSAAASAWGNPAMMKPWNSTGNGMEATCTDTSETILCADELTAAKPEEIGRVIYLIANGNGRLRAKQTGEKKEESHWFSIILSTSEETLPTVMRGEPTGGQKVRLVDIDCNPGKTGVFDDTRGLAPQAFATNIDAATKQFYGTAANIYLKHLVNLRNTQDGDKTLIKYILDLKEQILDEAGITDVKGDASVIAGRLALAAAGAEMAVDCGVLPWHGGRATSVCSEVFRDWYAENGSDVDNELITALSAVRDVIDRNGGARFIPWHFAKGTEEGVGTKYFDALGYVEHKDTTAQLPEHNIFYIFPGAWNSMFKSIEPRRAAKLLAEAGFLECSDGRLQRTVYVPGVGPKKFRVFRDVRTDDL